MHITSNSLTEQSGIGSSWAEPAIRVLDEPDTYLDILCDMAVEQNWDPSEMDWSCVDFSGIPLSIRQGLTNVFSQIHYGEVTALAGAVHLAKYGPTPTIRRFAQLQAADEAKHVKWFATLINKLDCRAKILPSVIRLMKDINQGETIEDRTLGMHLLVESMAHTIFKESSKLVSRMSFMQRSILPTRKLALIFGEWLPNYIAKDEARHLTFGIYFLQSQLRDMTLKRRDVLEANVNRWGGLFLDVASDPNLVALPGMDSQEVGAKCISEINTLLASVGLEARVAPLRSLSCASL